MNEHSASIADVKRAAETIGIDRIECRTWKPSSGGFVTVYPIDGAPLNVGSMSRDHAERLAAAVGTPERRIPLTICVLDQHMTDGEYRVVSRIEARP